MKTLWWKRSCRKFSRTSSTRQAHTTRSLLAKPLERCKTSRHKFSVASEASRGPNSACNCMEAPPPGCFVQLLNMWVCCLIPGLLWKGTKPEKRSIVFWSGADSATGRTLPSWTRPEWDQLCFESPPLDVWPPNRWLCLFPRCRRCCWTFSERYLDDCWTRQQ